MAAPILLVSIMNDWYLFHFVRGKDKGPLFYYLKIQAEVWKSTLKKLFRVRNFFIGAVFLPLTLSIERNYRAVRLYSRIKSIH